MQLSLLCCFSRAAHLDNAGRKKRKNEGSCWHKLAKKILPDQARGL